MALKDDVRDAIATSNAAADLLKAMDVVGAWSTYCCHGNMNVAAIEDYAKAASAKFRKQVSGNSG